MQFIETLQTNIRAKINAIVDISIDQVVVGSVLVSNTATFTDANSEAATAGQNALTAVYKSGDVAEIFGTSFGNVSVSNVQATEAKNPSKLHQALPFHVPAITVCHAIYEAMLCQGCLKFCSH